MDWDTYKTLSHSPEYFTRWALERTRAHVNATLAEPLNHALCNEPLPKPADHKGGVATDVLRIDLDRKVVDNLLTALQDARAELKLSEGSSQPNLNALIRSWEEYAEWLES